MATILDFPEVQVPPRRGPAHRSKSTAEIILFPGVRYERWDGADEAPAVRDAARSSVVRDRLQLIE